MKYPAIVLLASLLIISACKKDPTTTDEGDYSAVQNDSLKLNQIQIIASHNSYRVHTTDTVFKLLNNIKNALPPSLDPAGLDYTHPTFAKQFDNYNVRGLEIDLYYDPNGGLFANRAINSFTEYLPVESNIEELDAPGFKVLHIKDVDYNSNYYTFVSALKALKAWSDAHPNHLPLFINIESKEDSPADNAMLSGFGFTPAELFTSAGADALDDEIKSVFGNDLTNILTPDRLRGSLPTLNDVVLQNKWPTLGECRGKIIFIMEGNAVPFYENGHPSLQGRAMFTYAEPGTPEAAFVILNNAVKDAAEITQRVKEGYIVRSRSDANTDEARSGDYSAMNACFSSGAQITSTDYYRPDPRGGIDSGWTTFSVQFPNKELARKNPVNAANVNVPSRLRD
jgi:hypothetical protein